MFDFTFEDETGILRVTIFGAWTASEVHRFGHDAEGRFAGARAKVGHLRMLIDCSRGFVCPQELVEPLADAGLQYARHDDRVALVVTSSLMKIQIKRMMGNAPSNMFISDNAARMWLLAHVRDVAA